MKNEPGKQGRGAAPGNSPPVNESLENHRRRIDAIDQHLVDLLAERQCEVDLIADLKRANNLPVYHPAREENLISERRKQGKEAGLDPEAVDELFRCILRQSRGKQNARLTRRSVRPGAGVLIVGGRGRLGGYLAGWFADSGYAVRILDREDWGRAPELCSGVDLALVSVPIDVTVPVVRKLAPLLPNDCLLADVTSVKEVPLSVMLESHAGPVLGLHPLFGPMASSMDKQVVVYIHGRDPDRCQWLLDQFAAWGNILLQAEAREHDDIMSVVQALRHFATFVFGRFLIRNDFNLTRTLEFSSPIYRLEMGMVGRFFAQDPHLYAEIVFASAPRRELLKEFMRFWQEHEKMLEDGDKGRFIEEFRKVAEWFGPFSGQALRESAFLMDKYIERF
jgi:chorismate mutase / prephenate dehydrogenase